MKSGASTEVEAFLEVGRLLLGEPVDRDARRRAGLRDRSSESMSPITAASRDPGRQRHVAAAVGGHDLGREGERRRERARGDRAAADQGYRAGGVVEGAADCQSRITTAEMLFFGEPSMSLSE